MTTPQGPILALPPSAVQSAGVVTPTAIVDAHSTAAHDFFNVVRDLVKGARVYFDESTLGQALNVVDTFERRYIKPEMHRLVTKDTDDAKREDVTERIPPRTGYAPVPAAAPQIDYNLLARAIIQAQAEAQSVAPQQGITQEGE
jgi:hypothetical protein